MLRRAEDQLDVATETEEHPEQSLGGEALDLSRQQERHLGRRVADHARRFGLRQMVIADDRRDLARELLLRDERLVRPRSPRLHRGTGRAAGGFRIRGRFLRSRCAGRASSLLGSRHDVTLVAWVLWAGQYHADTASQPRRCAKINEFLEKSEGATRGSPRIANHASTLGTSRRLARGHLARGRADRPARSWPVAATLRSQPPLLDLAGETVEHELKTTSIPAPGGGDAPITTNGVAERRARWVFELVRDPLHGVRLPLEKRRHEKEPAPSHEHRRRRQLRARAEVHEGLAMDAERGRRIRDRHRATAECEPVLEEREYRRIHQRPQGAEHAIRRGRV